MKKFEITKSFRGGRTKYYAKMPNSKQMDRNKWRYQLEEWGEATDGGSNYGYNINAKRIKQIPRNTPKYRRLEFESSYLAIAHNTTGDSTK